MGGWGRRKWWSALEVGYGCEGFGGTRKAWVASFSGSRRLYLVALVRLHCRCEAVGRSAWYAIARSTLYILVGCFCSQLHVDEVIDSDLTPSDRSAPEAAVTLPNPA